jgi:hypothetical protein
MNNQEKILKIYDTILENKNLLEVMIKPGESNYYSNMSFADRTKGDEINKALLDDIQTAAERVGVKVTVDFAKTGHSKNSKSGNVSRHYRNSAVDIDFINGKPVSPENKEVVNKFVDALIAMGYNKNAEGESNPKAVLTFGFPGHDDHVHVSNLTDVASETPDTVQTPSPEETSDKSDTSSTNTFSFKPDPIELAMMKKIMSPFFKNESVNLKEAKIYSKFGKNISHNFGSVIIPKDNNEKIHSPVSGFIDNLRANTSCKNQVTVEHIVDGKPHYLEFCGISDVKVKSGDPVRPGTLLGLSDSEVIVTLFDSSWDKQYISSYLDKEVTKAEPIKQAKKSTIKNNNEFDTKTSDIKKKKDFEYSRDTDPIEAAIAQFITKTLRSPFTNKKNKEGKVTQNRAMVFPTDSKEKQAERGFLNPFVKNKKLTENIEKIKKLL